MNRLAQPKEADPEQLKAIAREFLALQAQQSRDASRHYGHYAKLAYDAGIPAQEIADTYGISLRSTHALIKRAGEAK